MTSPAAWHAAHLAAEFAEHLAPTVPLAEEPWAGQSLGQGAAGIALLHVERAHRQHGAWSTAHRWIGCAAATEVSAADSVGLYLGAPALAFLLSTVPAAFRHLYSDAQATLHGHVMELAHRRVDTAMARIASGDLPEFAEYDLFFGLTGIGAYLLRCRPDSSALGRILGYLVTLTSPLKTAGGTVPGWWVSHDPHRGHSAAFPGGHGNLGAAHGITGPLMLLAQAQRRGINVDGQADAMRVICAHLDAWRQDSPGGPWWPEHLSTADLDTGHLQHRHGPGRPSWCYGTVGIARAGQLCGIALRDTTMQRFYEDALYRCLTDAAQLGQITDTTLCHGWAGIYQSVFRAAQDASSPHLHTLLSALGLALLAHAKPASGKGLGLLEGDAGCGLALTTLATGEPPRTEWDSCLLID